MSRAIWLTPTTLGGFIFVWTEAVAGVLAGFLPHRNDRVHGCRSAQSDRAQDPSEPGDEMGGTYVAGGTGEDHEAEKVRALLAGKT